MKTKDFQNIEAQLKITYSCKRSVMNVFSILGFNLIKSVLEQQFFQVIIFT